MLRNPSFFYAKRSRKLTTTTEIAILVVIANIIVNIIVKCLPRFYQSLLLKKRLRFISAVIIIFIICAGKSFELHSRKKRLVNKYPGENIPVPIEQVPYIVNILGNGVSICAGSIITPITILSVARCFVYLGMTYKVISGSNHNKNGTSHTILSRVLQNDWDYNSHANDLTLLIIQPAINVVTGPNRKINIDDRNSPGFSHGTFSGWGCHKVMMGMRFLPTHLRSTTLPIISNKECQDLYGNELKILPTHICTYDRSHKKSSCVLDDGGPLAVLGKQVGVLTRSGMAWNPSVERPDVFVNVADTEIRKWIYSNAQYVY